MNNAAQQKNEALKALIRRTKIDPSFTHNSDALADEKIGFMAANCEKVLDVGKSSRARFKLFRPEQIVTTDINQYDGYPDIIDDICDTQHIPAGAFDGVICLAVLEHVYDPLSAVNNLYAALKDGGYCFVYMPFLYHYHARNDLTFQDYFRFTRDGIAYLFRNFSDVTIYPSRGRFSTMLNLTYPLEKVFGVGFNKLVDKVGGWASKGAQELQASGYFVWAVK